MPRRSPGKATGAFLCNTLHVRLGFPRGGGGGAPGSFPGRAAFTFSWRTLHPSTERHAHPLILETHPEEPNTFGVPTIPGWRPMDITVDELEERRSTRWTGWLILGTLGVVAAGGWGASQSISALMTRTEQLEREAAESEARVEELQVLREGLTRRGPPLEPHQQSAQASPRAASARRAGELSARRDAVRLALDPPLKAERERGTVYLEDAEGRLP